MSVVTKSLFPSDDKKKIPKDGQKKALPLSIIRQRYRFFRAKKEKKINRINPWVSKKPPKKEQKRKKKKTKKASEKMIGSV